MRNKKESFFWTSYSDLMTSLFFVMLVLFVLIIVLLRTRMSVTQKQLNEIRKVQESTNDLDTAKYFKYKEDLKKYELTIQVRYPVGEFDINKIKNADKEILLRQLAYAGREIQTFLTKHAEHKYLLIIEGQASKDSYYLNYELSYERALSLVRFWMEDSNINFGENCEVLISGSGDGTLPTNSKRDINETENQRFLIHILPKNILENETNASNK